MNNAEGLEKTIQSVVNQTFTDYEYLVIDGGSTDGSVDIIKKYVGKITYWVSEPDKGIYNAMNKGIKKAKGEYCLFLNSGDWLVNNKVLDKVFSLGFDEDIVYGNYLFKTNDKTTLKKPPDNITFDFLLDSSLPHTSSFIKKNLFTKFGYYNTNNKIISDWEFFLYTIIIKNVKTKYINETISMFDGNGISNQKKYRKKLLNEREKIIRIYFSNKILQSINEKKDIFDKYNRIRTNKFVIILKKLKLINE